MLLRLYEDTRDIKIFEIWFLASKKSLSWVEVDKCIVTTSILVHRYMWKACYLSTEHEPPAFESNNVFNAFLPGASYCA